MSTAVATQPNQNGAPTTELAKPEVNWGQIGTRPAKGNIPDLRRVLTTKKAELEAILGKDVAARLCVAIVTETVKSDRLLECSIQSLVSCAIEASRYKLEIGGVLGQSYMVPYNGTATFQVGYRGMVTLAHRSRRVASVCAVSVRAGDKFKVTQGTSRGIEHEPSEQLGNREVTHVYAVVQYRGGGTDFEVMTKDTINQHRDRFSPEWKYRGQASVWGQHWEQMALKTVLRRLLKRCPIGVDLGPEEFAEEIEDPQVPRQIETDETRQLEAGDNEVIDEKGEVHQKPAAKTEPAADAFAALLYGEIERLAVQAAGSWEAARSEYAEAFGITGTRVKDLSPEQAFRLRDQLKLDAAAKGAAA